MVCSTPESLPINKHSCHTHARMFKARKMKIQLGESCIQVLSIFLDDLREASGHVFVIAVMFCFGPSVFCVCLC